MNPKTKPAPSYSEYIPLETTTGHDSTMENPVTNKSTTMDNPTTITIDATNLKPIASYGAQRTLSPPPPPPPPPPPQISREEDGPVCGETGPVCGLFVMAAVVVVLVNMSMEILKYEPTFDPIIEVQSAWFSIYNVSSSRITTEGNITFNVTKPSDCSVAFYDTIVVSLSHMEKPLSIANMELFFQNESNHTMVKVIFPPTVATMEKPESERMARYFNSGLPFEFSFDVNAKGRLWQNNWKTEDDMAQERQMIVWCRDVKVKIVAKTGVGMMAGEPAKCKMKTFHETYNGA